MPDGTIPGAKAAANFVKCVLAEKPQLTVYASDLPTTAEALDGVLHRPGRVFNRGGTPVKIVLDPDTGPPRVVPLTPESVVNEAHEHCQPVQADAKGELKPVTLPDRVARLYLARSEYGLLPLNGISAAPLLDHSGSIHADEGYHAALKMWCCNLPPVGVPSNPTEEQARSALDLIRGCFATFPFADATLDENGRVDLAAPPGMDESAFLAAMLTAVCRPSLDLAPGLILTAPSLNGSGAGKGLLVRAISAVAFGISPGAVTTGSDPAELDKRIAAELVEAAPVLFLDNVNAKALKSDLLASVMTERPCRVRELGQSRMQLLNASAFVAVTGNGLSVSEDLARRFITCRLDPRVEDAELREFKPGFLKSVQEQRAELVTALLTIWRWGRDNHGELPRGLAFGSFETWCGWVRNPLLALSCADPVEGAQKAKQDDPQRRALGELFEAWWEHHGPTPMERTTLAEPVYALLNPQDRSRQWVATKLAQLVGTRAAGFTLTMEPNGKWSAATYVLRETSERTSAASLPAPEPPPAGAEPSAFEPPRPSKIVKRTPAMVAARIKKAAQGGSKR